MTVGIGGNGDNWSGEKELLKELQEVIGSELMSDMADDKQVEEDRLSAYSSDLDASYENHDNYHMHGVDPIGHHEGRLYQNNPKMLV